MNESLARSIAHTLPALLFAIFFYLLFKFAFNVDAGFFELFILFRIFYVESVVDENNRMLRELSDQDLTQG